MIRKVNLVHHKHKTSIQGFSDVQISDIESVINYSIDVIYCSILNKLDKSKVSYYLDTIANKVRYGGQLIIVVTDIRAVCASYVNKSISDEIFFETVKDVSQELDNETILSYLLSKHGFSIIGMEKNNHSVAMSFQRKNHD